MNIDLFHRLLDYYQIDENKYQELIAPVTIENFCSGHSFKRMNDAVKMVKNALKNNEKFFIYGDYDADGIMGTSILVKTLMSYGIRPYYYIPNRYQDGYGLTIEKAKLAVSKGVTMVITVDNGVSAFEPIKYLKEQGCKVLVLDHHTIQDTLPEADIIIHPQFSEFGETPTSGAFTAFMFSYALTGKFDKYLSTLAAISLISDMMPLRDYNRNFLRLVFNNYKDGEFYAIDLLKEGEKFDENTIGMKIAPKINSLGRMLTSNEINHVVSLFVQDDKELQLNLYKWLNLVNEERKTESKIATDQVKDIKTNDAALAIIVDSKEGLIGLIANTLCNSLHKPVVVFTKDKTNDELKGSCRAPEGFNVVDAFKSLSNLTITAGGHALAGGCSIKASDFEVFKAGFIKYSQENPIKEVVHNEVPLRISEISFEDYELVNSFSPFGEGWNSPLFVLKRIKTSALMFSRTGEHILTYIGQGAKIVGFGFNKEESTKYPYIDISGKLKTSTYKGILTLDYSIKSIRESDK